MSEEKNHDSQYFETLLEKSLRAKGAAENICAAEGVSIIHRNTVAIWFRRFNNRIMGLADEPISGHPSVVDDVRTRSHIKLLVIYQPKEELLQWLFILKTRAYEFKTKV